MSVLVSIHDVTPAMAPAVLALWNLCQRFQVTPALLVVPNWHGSWPLAGHPAFVGWLQQCAASGAEILLHGERHDETGLPRSPLDEFRALGRTAREGEFLTLNGREAAERIRRGLRVLNDAGLDPVGFVPPAWLAREGTYAAAHEMGLLLSEDARGVRVHARAAHLPAPAIRWSGRTSLRARGSAAVASARWYTQRHRPLLRLALHPQDLQNPVTAASVYREVERHLTHGSVVCYADL